MNEKIVRVTGYGLFCLSLTKFADFLKINKINTKKLNKFFDKERPLLEEAMRQGALLPLSKISSIRYVVDVTFNSQDLENDWIEVLSISGCNLSVGKDGAVWIGSLDMLDDWNAKEFNNEVISYKTLDGYTLNMAYKFLVNPGDYKVNIIGLKKSDVGEYTDANYKFLYQFKLAQAIAFSEYSNPLLQNVNIAKM